jgi:DNA (cytosine-5)-methyltransferase 1
MTSLRDARGILEQKLERIGRGEAPRVLDLFSGCGGISLGFHAAGYSITAAVEVDPVAALTHATNFHRHSRGDQFQAHAQARDIVTTEPEQLVSALGLGGREETARAFDVLVGGPPCQAYARVGRAKLRDVADHPSAYKVDPRGNLYLRYLHYVRATKPLAILIENVPDVLNYGGHNVMAEIAEVLEEEGYVARYTLINSAFHGVPQLRDRVFLIAYHQCLDAVVDFPSASRHLILPPGYNGTRSVAFKLIDPQNKVGFVAADHGDTQLPQPVTATEALGDLPPITIHLEGKLKRGARRFDQPLPYSDVGTTSTYAAALRTWPGFEQPPALLDHVIRYLPRDADIFRHMPNGGEYPAAHATAVALWEKHVRKLQEERPVSAEERERLRAAMVPPYPTTSFPNRWWKLRPDFPSRTLLAHIGKDTYSHIHYDSAQARVISVREAARLQSFPDGFVFCGTMNPAYRQIGNAVPPLMAKALAGEMLKVLRFASNLKKQPVAAE